MIEPSYPFKTSLSFFIFSDIVRRRERSLAEKHNENNIRANIHKQLQVIYLIELSYLIEAK